MLREAFIHRRKKVSRNVLLHAMKRVGVASLKGGAEYFAPFLKVSKFLNVICLHVFSIIISYLFTSRAGSYASELGLKVFCRLKINWKDFIQKKIAIHFTCSESCTLSKVNCKQRKSIGTQNK